MQEETQLPVYFAAETPQLLDIYREVKTSLNSDQADSAAEGGYLGVRGSSQNTNSNADFTMCTCVG